MNFRFTMALFAFAAMISPAVSAATVYTVTTDSSATYDSPLTLESASVTVDDGSESVVKPFAELVGAFETNSVFRKRGEGYLRSTPLLKTFTGEIRIEEGGWMVVTNGCLGVTAKAWAPKVVVSNGASLVVCPTTATCPGYKSGAVGCLRMYNPMTFEGEGYEGRGAISVDSEVSMAENGFSGDWTLSGDALFASYKSPRVACTSMRNAYVNGHTFTFKNKGVRGSIVMPQSFQAGSAGTAKVILDGVSCLMQDSAYQWWGGGSSNELILTNGATMSYYNFNAEPKWTLVTHAGALMTVSGTDKYPGNLEASGYFDTWGGPVRIEGDVFTVSGSTGRRGARYLNTVSGPGGIYAQDLFLQLYKTDNSFGGPVTVTRYNENWGDPGLALHRDGALPVEIPFVAITNAPTCLGYAEAFSLPPVKYTVKSGTQRIYGLASDVTFASLSKSGAGTLKIEVPFSVTGRTEIAAGTLVLPRRTNTTARLYSAMPGLWRGISPIEQGGFAKTDSVVYSNDVDGCFAMLGQKTYPPWERNHPTIWGGYIWNRSPTNETWTFAVSVRAAGRVYIDGVGFDANDNYSAVRLDNKVMAPGPHLFRFAVHPRTTTPGSEKNTASWTNSYGIAIDRQGRKSSDYRFYEFPMNDMAVTNAFGAPIAGGDGSLFTRDGRDTNEVAQTELAWMKREALFRELRIADGAAIDLSGADDGIEDAPLVVNALTGCGEVRNGSLAVGEKWTLDAAEKDSWPLSVPQGDLTFFDGAILDVDTDGLRQSTKGYVIAEAGGKVNVLPALSEKLQEEGWIVRVDPDDDGKLILCGKRKSLMITVR